MLFAVINTVKNFPCVTVKFPVFSLSGKSKNQIPCFPCAVATLGTPHLNLEWHTSQSRRLGYPPCQLDGIPSSRPGMGYPPWVKKDGVSPIIWMGVSPCPDLGWGNPQSRRMGYPLSAGWGTPHPDLGWGTLLGQERWATPHHLDGVPPVQTWNGVPPVSWIGYSPRPKVEQTHTSENIISRRTTYAGGKNSFKKSLADPYPII